MEAVISINRCDREIGSMLLPGFIVPKDVIFDSDPCKDWDLADPRDQVEAVYCNPNGLLVQIDNEGLRDDAAAPDVASAQWPTRNILADHLDGLFRNLKVRQSWVAEGTEVASEACIRFAQTVVERLMVAYGLIPYKITSNRSRRFN